MTLAPTPARKNEPDRNYFSSDNPPTRLDRPDAASEPYAPCKFGLTLDRFHNLHAIQIISQYAFFHPASLDLSLRSKKNISFGLLSFTAPTQLVRGHFALLAPPPLFPQPTHPPNGKNPLLGCFTNFQSSFSLHYHYSILLRSSFFALLFRNTKNGP